MTSPSGGAILLVSDIHSRYGVICGQIAHARETLGREVEQVLVLGDFGMFGPNLHDFFRRDGRRFAVPVSFIEGNHEDFQAFDQLVRDYADVVTYLPRNSVHEFGGWRWLCIGGARYMDAWSTPGGCEIRDEDINRCVGHPPGSIDFVISHDSPTGIGVTSHADLGHLGNPGVEGLARVAEHLKPRGWFFGHHHRWHENEHGGTRFLGLPQSWEGYALLDGNGEVERVEHEIALPRRPGWWKWIGLK
jgi:hypothetical protein